MRSLFHHTPALRSDGSHFSAMHRREPSHAAFSLYTYHLPVSNVVPFPGSGTTGTSNGGASPVTNRNLPASFR